jgi:hypothetical protein
MTSPVLPDDLLDAREASRYCKLAMTTMSGYRWKGGGPVYFLVGRRVFYSQRDLDAWMTSIVSRVEPAAS